MPAARSCRRRERSRRLLVVLGPAGGDEAALGGGGEVGEEGYLWRHGLRLDLFEGLASIEAAAIKGAVGDAQGLDSGFIQPGTL